MTGVRVPRFFRLFGLFRAFLAVAIVEATFLFVGQDGVGFGNLLKVFRRLFISVGVLIGMPLLVCVCVCKRERDSDSEGRQEGRDI